MTVGAKTRLGLAICAGLLSAALPLAAQAQEQPPDEAGAARAVWLFETLCFDNVPDLEAIAEIAEIEGFQPLEGEELAAYQHEVPADELRAWRFEDLGLSFVVSTSRTVPDERFKADVPDFADSIAFACSLSNPTAASAEAMAAAMTALMERPPEEIWDQPPLRAHSWSGEAEKLLVFVYFYGASSGGPGGLLSMSAFVKP